MERPTTPPQDASMRTSPATERVGTALSSGLGRVTKSASSLLKSVDARLLEPLQKQLSRLPQHFRLAGVEFYVSDLLTLTRPFLFLPFGLAVRLQSGTLAAVTCLVYLVLGALRDSSVGSKNSEPSEAFSPSTFLLSSTFPVLSAYTLLLSASYDTMSWPGALSWMVLMLALMAYDASLAALSCELGSPAWYGKEMKNRIRTVSRDWGMACLCWGTVAGLNPWSSWLASGPGFAFAGLSLVLASAIYAEGSDRMGQLRILRRHNQIPSSKKEE